MTLEYLLLIIIKTIELVKDIDFNGSTDPVISKELREAKSLRDVHSSIDKLRKKVS